MRSSIFVCLIPLVAVACGGSVADSNGGGAVIDNKNSNQNPQTHLPTGTMVGSFDVVFTRVSSTPTFSGASNPKVTSPSLDGKARLDVASDTATTAVMTPRWGSPATLGATPSSTRLALAAADANVSPTVTFAGPDASTGYYVTDRWSAITFGRTADGSFDGTFTATGDEEMFAGDVGFEAKLTATGTLALDTTAPELRAHALPPDGLLPWDPMHVQFAEPPAISQDQILSLAKGAVTPDPKTLDAQVLLTSWDVQSGAIGAKAFVDPAGNSSTASVLPVTYLNVGTAKPAFTFDDTSSPVAFYGNSSSLITTLPSDPACESGGCTKIGAISSYKCNTPTSGFAGILQQVAGHANTLHVRYRIFAGIDPDASSSASITPDGATFGIETATPGAPPIAQNVGFALSDLKTVPSTFGYTQATDWSTVDIPIASANQAGFAIQLGSHSCGGGPIFNDNVTTILIDSITIN